jgi:hypothetical protein
METVTKKKKKSKRGEYLLLTDYECLSDDEVMSDIHEMRERLKKIFRNHIGEENSITPVELFKQVYGMDSSYLDIFKKNYWWNILKKVLSSLKRDDTLFVINKGTKLFVLKTQEESNMFKEKIDRDVIRMKEMKIKADEWVKKKRWRDL